jgi:type I restriction enzyme S subunit
MPAETAYAAFLRELPQDWQTAQIAAIAKVVGGGTPSRDVPRFWGGDVSWVTPGEVSGEGSVYLSETRERITAVGLAGSGATLLPTGSLMITTRATLGARAINAVPMTTNQGFKSLVFESGADAPFYYYLTDKLRPELKRRASGTTFLEVSGAELARTKVPVPPDRERRLIAQVLNTLDTAIRQTEAIIEKLKQVKQGLLHDLLTRGIDANGELRPPQSQSPHLYKDSPLGWIPGEWEVVRLAMVLSGIEAGKSPACQDTPAFGDMWGVLKVGAVHPAGLRSAENKIVEDRYLWKAEYLVRKGDLLFSRANTAELVGLVCLVDYEPGKLMLSDKTLRLKLRADRMLSSFAVLVLQSSATRGQIENAATGTSGSMKNISQEALENLMIPAPTVDEQMRLAERVSAIAGRMDSEVASLSKLTALKSGLMDDLLTGRVRVTPLLA